MDELARISYRSAEGWYVDASIEQLRNELFMDGKLYDRRLPDYMLRFIGFTPASGSIIAEKIADFAAMQGFTVTDNDLWSIRDSAFIAVDQLLK